MHDQLKILGYDHPALLLFWFHLDGNVTNVHKIKLNQIFDTFFFKTEYMNSPYHLLLKMYIVFKFTVNCMRHTQCLGVLIIGCSQVVFMEKCHIYSKLLSHGYSRQMIGFKFEPILYLC